MYTRTHVLSCLFSSPTSRTPEVWTSPMVNVLALSQGIHFLEILTRSYIFVWYSTYFFILQYLNRRYKSKTARTVGSALAAIGSVSNLYLTDTYEMDHVNAFASLNTLFLIQHLILFIWYPLRPTMRWGYIICKHLIVSKGGL